jgi:hypothetical protein
MSGNLTAVSEAVLGFMERCPIERDSFTEEIYETAAVRTVHRVFAKLTVKSS